MRSYSMFVPVIAVALCALIACSKSEARPPAKARARIAINVTEHGFEPSHLLVTKGTPVTLVFERKTDRTCATEVVIHVDERQTIERKLPLNQQVEVAVTFPKSGELTYACGMDMIKGSIHVE